MNRLFIHIGCACLLILGTACREIPADRLYALYLDRAPTAADWERALPRTVTVKGGRVHKLNPLPDIDEDTVHTTTASCHHGAALPDPLPVDMRAFYNDGYLYLRLSWRDATRDDTMRPWRYDGRRWINEPRFEDGLGLLFDGERHFQGFSCSYACHIDNFGVSGANFHASNRMKLAREGSRLDLWNWKASRTARFGFADDRYLDAQGMHGDVPGELFLENSRARLEQQVATEIFGEHDSPLTDGDGRPVGKEFRAVGSVAPGYITERPVGGRGDIAASGGWQDGRWIVVLRRALATGDPHDVVFVPGAERGVAFGLSIMDDTLKEHYASTSKEQLVLLPRAGK